MMRIFLLLAAIFGGGFARASAPEPAGPTPVRAEVVRSGDSWTVTYRLPRRAPVWGFMRSANVEFTQESWRTRSWTVLTPGVRLERVGRYEALMATRGNVPQVVRIRFRPFTGSLAFDYVPALAFTDGTTALFDDHFALFSIASREVAAALPPNLNGQPIEDVGTEVSFRDRRGPVLHAGQRHARLTLRNSSSYVLFGARAPVETEAMAAIIEPQLPAWLAASLREMIPAILSRYAEQLGPAPGGKPTLLASWAGPTPAGAASMNGGVVAGTILMRFNGGGVVAENRQVRDMARWFIAHESAHFWLGQAVRYEGPADAWITEGGADLLAIRTVQAIDPEYDWRREMNRAIRECVALSKDRGVASALERNEQRAYYACGSVFAFLLEARAGRPFAAFVRQVVDANREDGVLTKAEWLAAARNWSGDSDLVQWIQTMVEQGSPDPAAAIAAMLERLHIPHDRAPNGAPRLT